MGLSHTVSGNIASFRSPSRVPIESLKFHFLPKQATGTPSPENPIPIEGWTGLNGRQEGKNLIDISALTGTNKVWWKGSVISGYNNHCVTPKIPVKPGVAYRLNRNSFSQSYVCYFDKNGDYVSQETWDNYVPSRTIPDNVYYVGITIGTEYLNNPKPLFTVGSQETEYTDYVEPRQIQITFPTTGKNLYHYDSSNFTTEDIPTQSAGVVRRQAYHTGVYGGTYTISTSIIDESTRPSGNYGIFNYGTYKNGEAHIIGLLIHTTTEYTKTITLARDEELIIITTADSIYAANRGIQKYNIQIEAGDAATSYVAYSSDNTYYGGYYDFVAGEIVATHKKFILTGYEDIPYSLYSGSIYTPSSKKSILADSKNGTTISGWSNMFEQTSGRNLQTYYIRKSYDGYGLQFYHAAYYFNLDELTAENFVAKLKSLNDSGNPLTIVYELATPIHISVAPQNLQSLLDHNNLWSNTNGITEVTYAVTESNDILATRKMAAMFENGHHKKVVLNQLACALSTTDWKAYGGTTNTITVVDDEATLTLNEISTTTYKNSIVTETSGRTYTYEGHKYYFMYQFCPSWSTQGIGFSILNQNSPVYPTAQANEYTSCSGICTETSTGYHNIMLSYSGFDKSWVAGNTVKCKAPIMVDLTKMFGEGNEPITATEFERICALNGFDLTIYHSKDTTGTEQYWIIP